MGIMITKFNLHLTMFHVKCKVRNSKNYICVSFHVKDKRECKWRKHLPLGKLMIKKQITKHGNCLRRALTPGGGVFHGRSRAREETYGISSKLRSRGRSKDEVLSQRATPSPLKRSGTLSTSSKRR